MVIMMAVIEFRAMCLTGTIFEKRELTEIINGRQRNSADVYMPEYAVGICPNVCWPRSA